MPTTKLQSVRKLLGYSADNVIKMLIDRAAMLGEPIMSHTSLKTKLSRWENGHDPVSPAYQRLFRDIFGRTNADLGFPDELVDDEAAELRSRIAVARSVDPETVAIFRRQVDDARHVDRRFGGISLLDQLRGHITQVEDLLRYGSRSGQRLPLAAVLVEASTLAGWESLDRNAIAPAWDHYERAKSAAREANSPGLLAHATAEQAFVMIELGETAAALDQLTEARTAADTRVSPLLRAWLAAAHGEGHAAAGNQVEALRAFDDAQALLPTNPRDPALPFLFLGDTHLARWRGNALARLGDPDAIKHLTAALAGLAPEFTRARVGMLVDLAFAHAAAGHREAAQAHARDARRLGQQIKTDRHLRRLSDLILPLGGSGVA
ncbi:tetratricopeptide repeat protein [Actinokineospora sp. G85]|uniref:tetratricopeptide repeat protein n=1 Tax=Actinokineospora sp. G85 TaxID=3406626 RepID=UPI003C747B6B